MPSYDWQSASEVKTYNFSTTLLEKGIIQNMLVEKKKKPFTTESTSNTIQLGSFSAQETETHVLY